MGTRGLGRCELWARLWVLRAQARPWLLSGQDFWGSIVALIALWGGDGSIGDGLATCVSGQGQGPSPKWTHARCLQRDHICLG